MALYEKATEILFSGDILHDVPLVEDTGHSMPVTTWRPWSGC
ncbi:hypothetical protein [Pararhizobium sp. LjRoot235]